MLCCSNVFDLDYDSLTQALEPIFSDDGTNTKRLEVATYKSSLDFLKTYNFDGMLVFSLYD